MNAAIIGYGKSTRAAEKLLRQKGYTDITVYDDNATLNFSPISHYEDRFDITLVSPGVDLTKLKEQPKNITSEIELAYEFLDDNAKIIAVTGTNGKSTTTFLTAQILNNVGIKAVACGNIGSPLAAVIADRSIDVFVVELSSFQIELLTKFRADAACILNLAPDHQDRYASEENYYLAKIKLLNFIPLNGFFISPELKIVADKVAQFYFDTKIIDPELKSYPKLDKNILDFGKFFIDVNRYKLFGFHNLLNLSYAVVLASYFYDFDNDISGVIANLKGMPHRTELVAEYRGVKYINDSKGTNVDSVLTALQSVNKPSTLLIGGRDKKSDYTVLADSINKNISRVLYFGEAAMLIQGQLATHIKDVEQQVFISLEEAVKFASNTAVDGETVLLSPACTSFDEFKNYEERGDKFREYVDKFAGGKK